MADSVSEAVGDAAKAAIDALAIPKPNVTPTAAIPCVKRKTPSVPEGESKGLPQVVVSVGEEGRTETLTKTKKLKTYPVAVTIVTNTGQQAADDATVRKWRQLIEQKLEARATWKTTLSGFNEVNVTNRVPFDSSALAKDYNYATVVAEVQVIETRS